MKVLLVGKEVYGWKKELSPQIELKPVKQSLGRDIVDQMDRYQTGLKVKRGWDGKRISHKEQIRLKDDITSYMEHFIERRRLVTKKDFIMSVLDD